MAKERMIFEVQWLLKDSELSNLGFSKATTLTTSFRSLKRAYRFIMKMKSRCSSIAFTEVWQYRYGRRSQWYAEQQYVRILPSHKPTVNLIETLLFRIENIGVGII